MSGEMREERKVVTAPFADVVGSTQYTKQMDPEDGRELLGGVASRIDPSGRPRSKGRRMKTGHKPEDRLCAGRRRTGTAREEPSSPRIPFQRR